MSNENKNSGFTESNSDNSRNNNGTIGGAGGVENEAKGSYKEMTERARDNNPVNERGIRENEENHSLTDVKYGEGSYAADEIDPNEIQKPDPDKKI